MKIPKHRYTAIKASGRTRVWDDAGWPEVFRDIYAELMGDGSRRDGYTMLLADGKMVVEPIETLNRVDDMVYEYCHETDLQLSMVRAAMMRKHWPHGEPPVEENNELGV
jgi:hypothetical protein